MAIDFPNSPTLNQIYTVGSRSWIWDGSTWNIYANVPNRYIQDAAPSSPQSGDQWFESDTGRLFVYYDSVWVEIGNATDIAGALQPGQVTALSAVTSLTTDDVFPVVDNPSSATAANKITAENLGSQLMQFAPQTTFRNAIINGDFRINQRAWSSSTADGTYGFDRWRSINSGGTVTMSSQTFTVGSPAATGYESPTFCRMVTSGQSGGNYAGILQYIEDVRTFANSTITVSFWAKAATSSKKVTLRIDQNFGSGGSPSSPINVLSSTITTTTSWARYTITGTLPNINGKTIGTTANTSSLLIALYVSHGSLDVGIQNDTFDFWGVQVERGSVATPFEQRPIGAELALCQRYYYSSGTVVNAFMSMNTNQFGEIISFAYPVTMRTTPTLTNSFTNNDNAVLANTYTTDKYNSIRVYPFNTGFAYGSITYSFTVSAEF